MSLLADCSSDYPDFQVTHEECLAHTPGRTAQLAQAAAPEGAPASSSGHVGAQP